MLFICKKVYYNRLRRNHPKDAVKKEGEPMRFKKLNENAIRCLISKEEMYDMGVNIDELIEDHDKAEGFLREIMEQAKDELGFETSGNAFNVQLSIMPEGDVSLMISEDEHSKARNMLAQFKERMKEFQETMGALEEMKQQSAGEEPVQEASQEKAEEQQKEAIARQLETPLFAKMKDLDTCMIVSRFLVPLGEMESSLYQYDGAYYLSINLSKLDRKVTEAILTIAEYSMELKPEGQGSDMVTEHGSKLLEHRALEILAQI